MNEEFFKLVEAMRHAQKEYFRTRNKDWLQKSKDLESQVDQAIFKHHNPTLDL